MNKWFWKQIVGNELYVWMAFNGRPFLLYKRWLNKDKGRVLYD